MVLCRNPDHLLTLRVFWLCMVAPFCHAKSAKCQRAISSASWASVCGSRAAIFNILPGFVLLDLIT